MPQALSIMDAADFPPLCIADADELGLAPTSIATVPPSPGYKDQHFIKYTAEEIIEIVQMVTDVLLPPSINPVSQSYR